MRFRLRTLLIVFALVPPAIAAPWYVADSVRIAVGASAETTALLLALIYLP